ncbi:endolytic transglycosylase MltG [Luteimicrobium subarcticum]|uniref:Endolytic murein transglycosylase n=1 Tax=Luteimicrobium subarcticum TaxID=620910 RepID=A0A2M8W401_9MICO|nr:endolytic transglycosylase MltG [Luteimicrobium subarcticum]PJI85629.1 UPF0755 protein [Luteimicrobium subarcticum]
MTDLFSAPAPTQTPQPPRSRSAQRRTQRVTAAQRRRRRRRRTAVLFLALLVVGGAGWFVYDKVLPGVDGFHLGSEAKDYAGPGTGSVDVTIEKGDTGAAIARTLVADDVVASTKAFTDAYKANPAAAGIQPGVYTLRTQMKASDVVALLAAQTGRVSTVLTIPEGFTVDQILDRASTVAGIPRSDFTKAMKNTKATGLPAVAKKNYEGWLYPATYSFDPGVTATDILSQMVAQTKTELKDLKVPASEQQDVLIKASMIEREAKVPADQPKMAEVINNRLKQGWTLGIDAAVAYGAGKSGTELTNADKADANNKYNLYVLTGLPPGPIASPGRSAVEAVVKPATGDLMFWTAVNLDTGKTLFASNKHDHDLNVAKLRAWQAANPGKG